MKSAGLGSHRPLSGQLYKYTNVVKGWQQRWFAVDPETGVLSYYLFDGPGDTIQPGQPARGEVRNISNGCFSVTTSTRCIFHPEVVEIEDICSADLTSL